MMAAQDGHLEVVKALIEAGANVNLGDEVCRDVYLICSLCNYYISCGIVHNVSFKLRVCYLAFAYIIGSILKSVCQFMSLVCH